jgi:hypothetical protein
MSRFRTILLSATIAGAFATPQIAANAAAASTDPVQALEIECRMKGGSVVATPFDLVRCQSARSNKGFEVERILCEAAVEGGTLIVTPIETKHNRSTWGCFDF